MANIGILKVKKLVDALLDFVQVDMDKYLANFFDPEEDIIGGVNYYDLAVELFSRTHLDNRKIETRLMFDHTRATLPTIHVREPAKNKGLQDGIGSMGEDVYVHDDGSYSEERRRSFTSQFELLITSANQHEVIIIEEVLLALLVGSQDTLALGSEFYQFNFTVKELIANNSLIPDPIFIKSIVITTSYDKFYPDLSQNEELTAILFTKNILTE